MAALAIVYLATLAMGSTPIEAAKWFGAGFSSILLDLNHYVFTFLMVASRVRA